MPVNLGVGAALRTGFRYALAHGYKRVVQCDGDGQHPPEQIPQLLDAQASSGVQLMIGSRFLETGESFPIGRTRRSTMRVLSRLVRLRTGVTVTDTTSGFRCIAEPLLSAFAQSFPTHYLGDTFEAVLVAARSGYRVAEEPVRMTARESGSSSEGVAGSIRFVLRARSSSRSRASPSASSTSTSALEHHAWWSRRSGDEVLRLGVGDDDRRGALLGLELELLRQLHADA